MNGSAQCPHTDLHFHHDVTYFRDANVVMLELHVHCNNCQAKMKFLGPYPLGLSYAMPTASLDGLRLSLPMCGETETPDKVMGLVGQVVIGPEGGDV
jgi:hypothetical protein